jgi:GTP-binding protein HflX
LLLHVVDAASEEREDNIEQVHEVLTEIGAGEIPRLEVYNKIDLMQMEPRIDRNAEGAPIRVWLSAQTGAGVELLPQAVAELLGEDMVDQSLNLQPDQGRLRARLYQMGAVTAEESRSDGTLCVDIRLARADWQRLLSSEHLEADALLVN